MPSPLSFEMFAEMVASECPAFNGFFFTRLTVLPERFAFNAARPFASARNCAGVALVFFVAIIVASD